MTVNADIQKRHEHSHTHAQKQTKVDTCEDRKMEKLTDLPLFFANMTESAFFLPSVKELKIRASGACS